MVPVGFSRRQLLAIVLSFIISSGVAAFCVISSGVAAEPPLYGLTWLGLSHSDLDDMGNATQRLLQQASGGAVRWQNPADHHAGVVRLIRSFEAGGMPCRTIGYTIDFEERRDSSDHYDVTWCRLPDGQWKIVPLAG